MTRTQPANSAVRWYFILVGVQILHSIEEIIARLFEWLPRVTGRMHETIDIVPRVSITREAFIIANTVVIAIMVVVGLFMLGKKRWAWRIAVVFGIVEIINGTGHLIEAVVTGGYFPGSISAIGLVGVGVLFIRSYLRQARSTV